MDIKLIKEKIKSINLTKPVLWLLVLMGTIIRIKGYSLNPSFWNDECALGVNINNIGSDYLKYFKPLDILQCAPPLFMVVCRIILDISHQAGHIYNQDLMLRLFPCICSIVSLPLFVFLIQKMTNNRYILWTSTAMIAFNKFAINYAQQFKQYSCEMMFTLILMLIFYTIDIKKVSIKKLSIFVLIFAISMWFSSSAILILFVGYLWLLFEIIKDKYFDKLKLSILFIPIINVIAYYFLYFKDVNNTWAKGMHYFWSTLCPSFFSFSNFPTMFIEKMQGIIIFPYSEYLIIYLLICLTIFFTEKNFNNKAKFLTITPIILLIIASFMNIYPFEARLILFLLPMFATIYSQIVSLLKLNKITTCLSIIIFILIGNFYLSISRNSLINIPFVPEDRCYREYAQYIIDNKIPPSKLIISPADTSAYYLENYYKNRKILIEENTWGEFKDTKLPNKIKTMPLGDYWLIVPFESKANIELKNYILNNSHLQIIDKIENNSSHFILHFKKISNYK